MDIDRLVQQMSFITEIDKVKSVIRQTALINRTRQENVSEHSWHIAVMAILLSEYSNEQNLDLLKVIKMLLIHDLVEIDAGDTFFYDEEGNHDKKEREQQAAERIFGLLPEDQGVHLKEIWNEFESMSTPEARYARALDAFQPVLMGYHNRGWSWEKHSITKSQVLEMKRPLMIGSGRLWDYTQYLMNKAAKSGFIENQ